MIFYITEGIYLLSRIPRVFLQKIKKKFLLGYPIQFLVSGFLKYLLQNWLLEHYRWILSHEIYSDFHLGFRLEAYSKATFISMRVLLMFIVFGYHLLNRRSFTIKSSWMIIVFNYPFLEYLRLRPYFIKKWRVRYSLAITLRVKPQDRVFFIYFFLLIFFQKLILYTFVLNYSLLAHYYLFLCWVTR